MLSRPECVRRPTRRSSRIAPATEAVAAMRRGERSSQFGCHFLRQCNRVRFDGGRRVIGSDTDLSRERASAVEHEQIGEGIAAAIESLLTNARYRRPLLPERLAELRRILERVQHEKDAAALARGTLWSELVFKRSAFLDRAFSVRRRHLQRQF